MREKLAAEMEHIKLLTKSIRTGHKLYLMRLMMFADANTYIRVWWYAPIKWYKWTVQCTYNVCEWSVCVCVRVYAEHIQPHEYTNLS